MNLLHENKHTAIIMEYYKHQLHLPVQLSFPQVPSRPAPSRLVALDQ